MRLFKFQRILAGIVAAALLVAALVTTVPTRAVTSCTFIHDIQGAAHTSPCLGQAVTNVSGIVTGPYYSSTTIKGWYMQAAASDYDTNDNSSEGILVYAPSVAATVAVGDAVTVGGTVQEFRPGGASGGGLTVTEIGGKVVVHIGSHSNPLPPPIVIGAGGRVPPNVAIESAPNCTNVETACTAFDPTKNGIDFWKSLEGMRVTINNAYVVGPTSQYYETVVVPDNGSGIVTKTPRGGALISSTNYNPERVYIANDIAKGQGQKTFPTMNVTDTIPSLTGILDYNFKNYRVELTAPIAPVSGGLTQAVTTPQTANQLAIATFNVENFNAATSPTGKVPKLANLVVNNLKSPDIITVEEVQDNSGATDDGTVAADQNWNALISAITTAGGPTYSYTEIDPVSDQDGGQPGGNIRQGFLYNPLRVSLISHPGATPTTANAVVCANGKATLQYSPGRIDPTNTAWTTSRKPLAAEFMFNGSDVIVIGNHLVAKLGDQPLYGPVQPPALSSAVQRTQQTTDLNAFVSQITACQANANIIVLGDLNDYPFSDPIKALAGTVLDNLMLTLPANQQYSYDFDGNSQVLDQVLVSKNLTAKASPQYDVVHVNSEFFSNVLPNSIRASDHDPSIARLSIR